MVEDEGYTVVVTDMARAQEQGGTVLSVYEGR